MRVGWLKKRLFLLGLLLFLSLWMSSSTVSGWNDHHLITYYSLEEFQGSWPTVIEKPYAYEEQDLSEYNPGFIREYLHSDKEDLTALQVLIDYSDEPDWYLDSGLNLSRYQILTGGSHGWRHQRYTLLNGLMVFGEAPQRAQHFYDLALLAYNERDVYWAFRSLSMALHYLQDMGQPYHSLPMPALHLLTRHRLNIANATIVAENAHYVFEEYVSWCLYQEHPPFLDALSGTDYVYITSVEEAAIDLNMEMRKIAEEQYLLTLEIWPLLNTPVSTRVEFEEELFSTQRALVRLHEIMEYTLATTAEYTRGLIKRFLEDTGLEL